MDILLNIFRRRALEPRGLNGMGRYKFSSNNSNFNVLAYLEQDYGTKYVSNINRNINLHKNVNT